jgi:DNA-directed RNA polymerase subunit M/transcription elongation factor TFIIS
MSRPVFCPKCDTLLSPETVEGKVQLNCSNCAYTENLDTTTLMRVNVHSVGTVKSMNKSMIYDSALRRTNTIECVNQECESLDPTKWGTNVDGRTVQPSISLTNFFSEDRISTYICNTCGQTFNPIGAHG